MKNLLFILLLGVTLVTCKNQESTPPNAVLRVALTISPDSVTLDPSGYAPLSALLRFSTAQTGKTFIRVKGKHGAITNVEHLFNDKGTQHAVPILGLYPNYANSVDVRLVSDGGDTLAQTTLAIQTGELPPNMPVAIAAQPFSEAQVAGGLILVSNFSTRGTGSPDLPFFMDAYGDIRWILDYRDHPTLKNLDYDDGIERLRNGNFFFGDITTAAIYEVDLLGQVLHSWPLPGYSFHHNVIEKPGGNFIVTTSKPGSTKADGSSTIEDYVIELDRNNGRLLNEWDLKQSLDENRTALAHTFGAEDWFHGNSILYDSTDNSIIVSGRHQGVVKLDYNNRVKWILGAHRGWGQNRRGEDLNSFLLTPLNAGGKVITDAAVVDGSQVASDFEWNWYQHSPIFLPNGDIMMFDNGDIREFNSDATKYSRAVSFKIDPAKRTVQQTWAYGKERGTNTFSSVVSSVQWLPLAQANHVLFCPGFQVSNTTGTGGKVVEVDFATRQVVSEISISSANDWGFHRAKKMSAYP